MYFPENPEEFIDSYKFKDSKEYYTNGSDLIQVFRVKQMLDHYLHKKEVKHGKWLYHLEPTRGTHYSAVVICDNCCQSFARLDGVNFNYCPNCGAKMDKEGD